MNRTFRFWAGFDLAVTSMLATPPTAGLVVGLTFHLSGREVPADFESGGRFFVCLAGTLGVIWAIARLKDPRRPLVQMDIVGRIYVASLIGVFVWIYAAPNALLLFTLTELMGAGHQAWTLARQ